MHATLFYLFAALALMSGLLVAFNPFSRNPVTRAMFLVLAMIALSGLFVLLHAYFLAAIQVLVYAGAVMVLFLFVIMLMDLRESERRRVGAFAAVLGLAAVSGLGALLFGALRQAPAGTEAAVGSTRDLGRLLFTQHLFPFEIVSVLLLVAMVGVIMLSQREAE